MKGFCEGRRDFADFVLWTDEISTLSYDAAFGMGDEDGWCVDGAYFGVVSGLYCDSAERDGRNSRSSSRSGSGAALKLCVAEVWIWLVWIDRCTVVVCIVEEEVRRELSILEFESLESDIESCSGQQDSGNSTFLLSMLCLSGELMRATLFTQLRCIASRNSEYSMRKTKRYAREGNRYSGCRGSFVWTATLVRVRCSPLTFLASDELLIGVLPSGWLLSLELKINCWWKFDSNPSCWF